MSKNPHAVALGKKGGRVTSERKADAARKNGKKGGRPSMNEIKAGWQRLKHELGPELGESLPFAREYLGDEAFIRLATEFSAGEVIVACGVNDVVDLVGVKLRPGKTKRDRRLQAAVVSGRQAKVATQSQETAPDA